MALLQRLISVYSGTGSRTIVLIDSDDWSGMCAPEGLSRGHNNVGKALMQVRASVSDKDLDLYLGFEKEYGSLG